MLNNISLLNQLVEEMVEQQKAKVFKIARDILPNVTPEDLLNPQDFPELKTDTLFNYEDGILTGYLSMRSAFRNLQKI